MNVNLTRKKGNYHNSLVLSMMKRRSHMAGLALNNMAISLQQQQQQQQSCKRRDAIETFQDSLDLMKIASSAPSASPTTNDAEDEAEATRISRIVDQKMEQGTRRLSCSIGGSSSSIQQATNLAIVPDDNLDVMIASVEHQQQQQQQGQQQVSSSSDTAAGLPLPSNSHSLGESSAATATPMPTSISMIRIEEGCARDITRSTVRNVDMDCAIVLYNMGVSTKMMSSTTPVMERSLKEKAIKLLDLSRAILFRRLSSSSSSSQQQCTSSATTTTDDNLCILAKATSVALVVTFGLIQVLSSNNGNSESNNAKLRECLHQLEGLKESARNLGMLLLGGCTTYNKSGIGSKTIAPAA